ncbi:MAG: hypothetical protein F6K30_07405 [Cyanothece sp. SIO2G6]|nr:hypothetical protein [Cyanothece sp. SIO2G6]
MGKTLVLETDYEQEELKEMNVFSTREIVANFLDKDYEIFILMDCNLKKFSGEAFLYFDYDLDIFLESYLFLEESLLSEETFKHNTFLGDGILFIEAWIDKARANVKYEYCPQLDAVNLETIEFEVTVDQYLSWWRKSIKKIVDLHLELL